MKDNNFSSLLAILIPVFFLIPFLLPIYFYLNKKKKNKLKKLNDVFNEIKMLYEDEEVYKMEVKLDIKKESIADLYNSYELLIKKENLLLYLINKKAEYENILKEIKGLTLFKRNLLINKKWDFYKSKDDNEVVILRNINADKNKIYVYFKELNNI